jgi:hypothetical protein
MFVANMSPRMAHVGVGGEKNTRHGCGLPAYARHDNKVCTVKTWPVLRKSGDTMTAINFVARSGAFQVNRSGVQTIRAQRRSGPMAVRKPL